MSEGASRFPRALGSGSAKFELRLMTSGDEAALLAFANAVPSHDLLFLRRDIRVAKVLTAWMREMESGQLWSLVALRDGQIVGSAVIARDPHSFSAHVGDLRVLLAPSARDQGLGRALIQESFLVALGLGLDKLTAHMTADQTAGIAVFEDMGFRAEALLRDHVRDDNGKTFDIIILSQDVQAHLAKMDLYGLPEAFD